MNIVYCIVLSLGRASLLPHALKLGAPLLSLFSTHPTEDSDSSLTLSREMQLAEHFAFISSTKDDPNRVTAICVEADQDRAIKRPKDFRDARIEVKPCVTEREARMRGLCQNR